MARVIKQMDTRGCSARVSSAGLTAAGFNRVGGGIRGPIHGLTQGPGPGPGTSTSGATRAASTGAAVMAGDEVGRGEWWVAAGGGEG
jgi:hypothetical protein